MKITIQDVLATILTIFGCSYIFWVTIMPIPVANQRIVDTCTGFVMGTILASLIGFYWGSSKSSSDKTKLLAQSTPIADKSVTISEADKTTTNGAQSS